MKKLLLLAPASLLLTGCPRAVGVDERLPAAPALERGNVDEGALGKVKRPSRLTADPTQEYDPALSPDGGVVAYVSHRRGNADVFLRFLPGSGRVGEYPMVDHYAADGDATWSPNGRQIAFVSRRDDPKGDLYIYSLKSGDRVPDAVRDAVLAKFGEALTLPDSGWDPASREQLERVSEFLEKRDPVIRLSDAEREDRSPAWGPDGRTIYYSSRKPGEPENLWTMDVRSFDAKQLTTDGGFDAAPSRDGKHLVYVSRAEDANGGLRVRRLSDGVTVALTAGAPIDGFPSWGGDGKTIFFSRYAFDTNEDGKIDVNDRPAVFGLPFDAEKAFAKAPLATPYPVTPSGNYDLFPAIAGGRLFYSSDDGVNSDIWAIPEAGIFPALATAAEDLSLADALAGEPALRLLLLEQVVAKRGNEATVAPAVQDARIGAARLRADRRELDAARETVKSILDDPRIDGPRKARARILSHRIAAIRAERSGPGGVLDKPALRKAAEALEQLATTIDTKPERAEALLEAGYARMKAGDSLAATESWQRAVKEGDGWPKAEAWLSAAMAYGDLGQADRSVSTFIAALQANHELMIPAERRADIERARAQLLARIQKAIGESAKSAAHSAGIDASALPDVGIAETYGERAAEGVAAAAILGSPDGLGAIAALRDLANRHKDLPVLPALARNEIGDMYVRLGDLESASLEYAAVAESKADARQVQRARLSGAKALLIAGRYEDAVKALGPPPPPEIPGGAAAQLARRARKAYVRTLLAKADEEFRSKDVQKARKSYRAVLAVDAREVRAHRGLIACYAALGEPERAAKIYEDEAKKTPDDPLIRYGVGLAYSYRTPEAKWMPRAEAELKRAVFLDDSAVFPHQTLGFVYEKQEELFGDEGGFEKAADQYLLALSLNDVREDFRNEADLLLNVGNAFFNLQNYRRAYEFYARRERADVPFDVVGRELVWRERIAKCAMETNRFEEAVKRYDTALAFLDALPEKELPKKTVDEHRARLLDERAFTLDQAGESSKAAVAYLDAAKANSIAGNGDNSARALRNAAINLFEKGTGDAAGVDEPALLEALVLLEQSLDGVSKHGVVEQKDLRKKKALFSYNMNISMSLDASDAVEGFNLAGEKELIFTFVGRIYEALEDPVRAREYYEKKRSMLPAKPPDAQRASVDFKRALLENQIGVLAHAAGDMPAAWTNLKDSYGHSLSLGNVHGGMTNAVNLALIALESKNVAWQTEALETVKDALSLLEKTGVPDPERYFAALHAVRGALLVEQAALAGKPKDAAAAMTALKDQGAKLAEAEKAYLAARAAIDGAVKPHPEMNRTRVQVLRGLGRLSAIRGDAPGAAKHFAEAAKAATERGMDGLAALSRVEAAGLANDDKALEAALVELEKVPAPILGRELDLHGIEPWYRRIAAKSLAAGDATAAIVAMERLRALQVVARAGGAIPRSRADEVGASAKAVSDRSDAVVRAHEALGKSTLPAASVEWKAQRAALDAASKAYGEALEAWGGWDAIGWSLAFPAPLDVGSMFLAIPEGTGFVYFIAQPDGLWSIVCDGAAAECKAEKAGPLSPATAAKALEAAVAKLAAGARVQIVPDVGLYDAKWIPAGVRAGRVVALQASAAAASAADGRRAPYRERQDVASTAGAKSFLDAAPRADALRLDVTGTVPRGRPLDAHWDLTLPAGPPPVRRVTAEDVLRSGTAPAIIVADVAPSSDPETLLALADLWIRGGAATVVFLDPKDSDAGDKVAVGGPLTVAPALLLSGHPGMSATELKTFAEEAINASVDVANHAMNEKRWDDALASFERALYLMDVLAAPGPKADVLRAMTMASYNAEQWERGERYAAAQVKAVEAAGEKGVKHADALVLLGVMQQRAEHFDAAVATLNLAVQRYKELGIPEGISQSMATLGMTFEKKLKASEAVESFRSALKVEEELGRSSGVGDLHRKIGRMNYVFLEDYAKAEASFEAARKAYLQAKDAKGEDEARLELGLVAERRAALDESRKAYQAVYDRAVARKDDAVRAKASLFLANTAWLSADYQTAFTRVRETRRLAEELKDVRLQFLSRSTEGLIFWTLNDLDRATALQNEALELARKLKSPLDEASTHNNLGILWRSAGEYDRAVEQFEKALAIDKKQGSKWGQAYDLRNLGLTWLMSENPARAGEPLQEAVTLAAAIGDKVNGTKATLALADYYKVQGDASQAKALYARALEASTAAHLPEVTWRARRGLANIAADAGDYAKARTELDAALAVVEELRGAIKVEELKNGFIADKLDLYDDAIRLALDHPPAGVDGALLAWSYSERSRARSFIDLLANRKMELSSPDDSRRLGEQRALKDRIFAAEDALVKAPEAEKPALSKALSDLRETYRDLLVEIRAANPRLSAFVTVEPPTIADVRKVIGKDTVLLEYHVGPRETIAWTITDGSLKVTRIATGRDALSKTVKDYLTKMEAIRPIDAEARSLWKLLVEPALGVPEAKGKRYVGIIPHGVLHYVPFAALRSDSNDDYLVDRYALFYVPSAAVLPLTLTAKSPFSNEEKAIARVLAIGNPDLGDPSFALPFAELEVNDIKLDFPRIDVLTRERATDRWVSKNIGGYRVIHFACHGEFDPVNPLFSSLRLAREPGEKEGGALEAHEIFGLPLKAELVTLSACRTGLGKIEAGDELIGLNRAFLYAGTRSIMSTLWRVHDGSTAVLVKHFYRGYAREPKADALRDSMRQVREYYPHPAYWAAFALTGEYR